MKLSAYFITGLGVGWVLATLGKSLDTSQFWTGIVIVLILILIWRKNQ